MTLSRVTNMWGLYKVYASRNIWNIVRLLDILESHRIFRLLLDYVERVEYVLEAVGQDQIALPRLSVQHLNETVGLQQEMYINLIAQTSMLLP